MFTQKQKILTRNWLISNPRIAALIFFAFLLGIIFLMAHQRHQILKENRDKDIADILEDVELRFDQLLKNSQNIALTLALTLDERGEPQHFEAVAEKIMKANSHLQALQLVPNGVIKYIYPLKGNEDAKGLNLFSASKASALEAKKAILLQKMYFQGPVKLVQGNVGVIGRLPLYINNEFWGFAAVVIRLDELLKNAGIDNEKYEFYKFQFSKVNPVSGIEEFFVENDFELKDKNYKTKMFDEGDWKVYLIDIRENYAVYQLGSLVIFGVILSAFTSYLLMRLLLKQSQLFKTVDQQYDQLATAENKYKTIFDFAAVGIGRVDSKTGEFLEANAFLCKLFGYSQKELTHKKIKSLIHLEDLDADAKNFKRLLGNEIRQFSSVRRYVNKNNEVIWANAVITPLWSQNEKPSQHIVIIEDITQRVEYETKLIASQKHIEELINSIDGVVWEASIKNNFANTFISNKVYDILGYTPQEWVSEPNFLYGKIYEEDKKAFFDYIEKELYTKQRHVHEYRVIAKDGSLIWIRDIVNIAPSLAQPETLRGIMLDITSVKNAEEALNQSFKLVNEQNKRLLNFSYIVSHNLRSHASNIDGITSLISNADTEQERTEMIQLLQKVVGNLNDTLYNLNNIVNIQTSIDVVKEPLNLKEYLDKAIHTQESQLLNKQAVLINEVAAHVSVVFNKAYLESVLLNLISNALRYSHPDRKPIINLSCERKAEDWVLSISDNGLGIDLARNGDKLFGLNQTFNGNSDARGFGLFITKNQIEAMGGKIEVDSILGEGTTFRVYFHGSA